MRLNYHLIIKVLFILLFLQSERMLLRGQRRCLSFTAKRKGSPFEASLGGRMRYPTASSVHVLPIEARGDFEDGKSNYFST